MIRAARGLLNIDQAKLGELVGVARRTIIRLEADETEPTNPRRIEVVAAIRDWGHRHLVSDAVAEAAE